MSDVSQQGPRQRRGWKTIGNVCGLLILVFLLGVFILDEVSWEQAAPKAVCLSNIAQLAKAMRLYSLDYNDRIFFDRADAFSRPLVPADYAQTRYLKRAMKKYVPDWGIWRCPSDPYAQKDFTCSSTTFGTFNYRQSGLGCIAIPHKDDSDPGIRALRATLLEQYGTDDMRLDHNESSYRFIPALPGERPPVLVDSRHGDVKPANAPVFEEDLPFHPTNPHQFLGTKVYGKIWAYRDGLSHFQTAIPSVLRNPGLPKSGEAPGVPSRPSRRGAPLVLPHRADQTSAPTESARRTPRERTRAPRRGSMVCYLRSSRGALWPSV